MNDISPTTPSELSFSFALQKDDLIQTMRAFYMQQKSTLFIGVFLIMMSVCSTASIFVASSYPTTAIIFPFLAFFYFLLLFFLQPVILGNKVEANERLSTESTWTAGQNKISIKNKFHETSFDWGSLREVLEMDSHFLFIFNTNKNFFQLLPKRAFVSAEQMNEFRELVMAKVERVRPIRSVNLPVIPALTLYIIIGAILLAAIVIVFLSSLLNS